MTPVSLPPFPWPVPKPSALEVLTLESLGKLAGTGVTFRDVDERITNALYSAGYDDKSYFGVPGGFAIVTRLEKMDEFGNSDYSNRWASALSPISLVDFSLTKYLEALFGVPKGHYRVFVFVISSEIVVQSGTPAVQEDAQTWIVEGANKLPNQMKDLPYTREHTTTAYIYEFIQSGVGEAASYNIPSDFTGRQHLERANLWKNLNYGCQPDEDGMKITYGSVVKAKLCPLYEWDGFHFSGVRGDRVRIIVKPEDATAEFCVGLSKPDQDFIGTWCRHTNEEVFTLDQTGDFTIWVTTLWRAGEGGSYTLELEQIP